MVAAVDADALIVGAGCAGLSLAVHVAAAARRSGRACPRVVLLEPRAAYRRDRTWCGWRVGDGHPFAAAVTRRWTRWAVQDGARRVVRGSERHPYEHVAADGFYAAAQALLATERSIDLRLAVAVTGLEDRGDHVVAETSAGPLRAAVAFDSRPGPSAPAGGVDEVTLVQNFVGLEVEVDRPVFDPDVVEMMDFAVSQARGLHFMYVLPFTRTRALVEATYFTHAVIAEAQAEADVRGWLARRGVVDLAVMFRERGEISMTTAPAQARSSPRVIHLGLRGGLAKPSTGYAFAAIQRFSAALAAKIVARPGGPIEPPAARPASAVAMDRVFLSYVDHHPARAPGLFVDLFERLPPALLCRFLTDHAGPLDNLRVMASTPLGEMTAEVVRSRARWLRRAVASS